MLETEHGPMRDEFIRRGLRFSQLRLLVALKETGQISAAAGQLGITQPAASRLLAELERLSEAQLYRRHSRGVSLTEAGEHLTQRARAVLHLLDDTHAELGDLTSGARGEVRIGAVTGPAMELVLPVIRELRVTSPDIQVSVLVDTSDRLAEALMTQDLDFYIGRLHDTLDTQRIQMRPVGPEPVSLIVRDGHPLLRQDTVRLEDCLGFDWVMQPPEGLQRRTIEHYLLAHGYALPNRVLGTASLLLTLALVTETNAVAPVSRAVAQFHARPGLNGSRIRILDSITGIAVAPYSVIRPRDRAQSAAAERVLALIDQKIEAMGPTAGADIAPPAS